MNTSRQIFRNQMPTSTTRLRGITRVHGNHQSTSFFRFVLQQLPKLAQPCIVRRQGKMFIAVHESQGQIFNANQVKPRDQRTGDLMQVIASLIGNVLMLFIHLAIGFLLTQAALHLTRGMTLYLPQMVQTVSQPMRVLDQLSGGKRQQTLQSDIDPNRLSCGNTSCDSLRDFQHQAGIPAIIDSLDDHMLDNRPFWQRAVKAHAHLPHVLKVETPTPMFVLAQFAAVAIRVFDAFEAVPTFESRKSWGFTGLHPAKECSKRFLQAAQQLLNTGRIEFAKGVRVFMARIPKGRPLRSISNSFARLLVSRDPLFEGSIVNPSGLPKLKIQGLSLFGIGAKKVFIRADHRTIVLQINQGFYFYSQKGGRATASVA